MDKSLSCSFNQAYFLNLPNYLFTRLAQYGGQPIPLPLTTLNRRLETICQTQTCANPNIFRWVQVPNIMSFLLFMSIQPNSLTRIVKEKITTIDFQLPSKHVAIKVLNVFFFPWSWLHYDVLKTHRMPSHFFRGPTIFDATAELMSIYPKPLTIAVWLRNMVS